MAETFRASRVVVRDVPAHQDPWDPVLVNSTSLAVSDEQKFWIQEILSICCSDTLFAKKAYIAIHKILTGGLITPTIVSLSPANATLGDPSFDIHVMGTNFTPESIIVFNGFDEPTTFVSATELTTGVNMPLWQAPAVVPVRVRSSEDVLSNAVDFEFKEIPVLLSASKTKEPVKEKVFGPTPPPKEKK